MGRLFWKFFVSIWLVQGIAVLAISGSIWLKERNHAKLGAGLDASPPAAFALDAAAATLQFGGASALRSLLQQMERHQVYAIDQGGRDILDRQVGPATVEQAQQLAEHNGNPRTIRRLTAADGQAYLLFVPRMENDAGPRPPPDGRHPPPPPGPGGSPYFPALPMVLAMLASLVSAALLAWHFSKPIRTLRTAFEAASGGNLEPRIGPAMGKRRDELADLGRDFDRMAAQLQALVDGQRRLLHDVSHELRSPLARLQAAIGLARQSPEKIDASFERIERESIRMDRLVGELLILSRLEVGVIGDMEEVNLGELVADIVDDARFEAETQGKTVSLQDTCLALPKGQAELLHRAIENVVRNAVKHTAHDSAVDVVVSMDNNVHHGIRITVCDHGPGVPDAELHAIFEPFFRSGSTGKNTEGHGLGLAIAKRIIDAHHGSIRASNRVTGGLCVEILLPAPDSP